MYLFIFESIGTSELLLVGIVALIVFGPRKLPEMMRKFGRIMNEFRKTTGEFKEAWEREASALEMEEESRTGDTGGLLTEKTDETAAEYSVYPETAAVEREILPPEIKEINRQSFDFELPATDGAPNEEQTTSAAAENEMMDERTKPDQIEGDPGGDKRDWL